VQKGPSGLLLKLQQLTCSLQEASRMQDSQQLSLLLRLLASFPVTAELLLLSQAGAALRQLLRQQEKQQQQQQQQQQGAGAAAGEIAAAARRLLLRWKAALAAEVAAADSSSKQKALQVRTARCYVHVNAFAVLAACLALHHMFKQVHFIICSSRREHSSMLSSPGTTCTMTMASAIFSYVMLGSRCLYCSCLLCI
jgi:hypothetical protein